MGKTELKEFKKRVDTEFGKNEQKTKIKSKVKAYRMRKRRKRVAIKCIFLLLLFLFITFAIWNIRTSRFDAWLYSDISSRFSYWLEPGESKEIVFPSAGPYDKRFGYSDIDDYTDNLKDQGYKIDQQARFSPALLSATKKGIYAIYREKTQSGLRIYDCDGNLISSSVYPQRIYQNIESIPKIIVDTLLFIENRELLDESNPYRNPAIEWDRFAKAILDTGINKVYKNHKAIGGSTMATQLEKYRHSPDGKTSGGKDKLMQMTSAALRAYYNGQETMEARKQLVVDYINSVPLAACSGFGEVSGLGDGLWVWYGADFDEVNRLLSSDLKSLPPDQLQKASLAYKQVLSLFLAHRRPSDYLNRKPDNGKKNGENKETEDINTRTNKFLNVLYKKGVIPLSLKNSAYQQTLKPNREIKNQEDKSQYVRRKAIDTIRKSLVSTMGATDLYNLDRLDLSIYSTIDNNIQKEVTNFFQQLNDLEFAKSQGMVGERLLNDKVSEVIYSFILYEHVNGANLLRVQSDNNPKPLDINEQIMLELGSTAKLRTLVTYLEIIAELHKKYSGMTPEELRKVEIHESDNLSEWAISYLSTARDKSLKAMIESAMERRYSGNPGEGFFTGGGMHWFVNFESWENSKMATVTEALQDSINLSFIRIMRDIVKYYTYQVPGSSAKVLEEPNHPLRKEYLKKFADKEGQIFLRRFYNKYTTEINEAENNENKSDDKQKKKAIAKTPDEMLDMLVSDTNPVLSRLAVIFRSVKPEAPISEFANFMQTRSKKSITDEEIDKLYNNYSKSAYNLADRGYIAKVHPLELWIVEYLSKHPDATFKEAVEESSEELQAIYSWLFKTSRKDAQDKRIKMLIEIEAFQEIHKSWKRLGYPFDSLTPSYATAIGVSGDRPSALAELMGIIQNKGIRYPNIKIQKLHFAQNTPYETIMTVNKNSGEQVIAPEIAEVVRKALINVVENGTAKRLNKTFIKPDGTIIPIGGKTGTGDNRCDKTDPKGHIIKSEIRSRTATFVFLIGDRFFGTVTAYVEGENAENYRFTSTLPVQLLKVLAPKLMPLVNPKPVIKPNIAKKTSVPVTNPVEKTDSVVQSPAITSPIVEKKPTTVTKPDLPVDDKATKQTIEERPKDKNVVYSIKLGTFSSKENANEIVNKMKSFGFTTRIVTETANDKTLYHVCLGRFDSSESAKKFGDNLKKTHGVKDYIIRESSK